jgi:hypothetical protein
VYIVRHAHSTHYQGQFYEFIQELASFVGDIQVDIYNPENNYANDYLVLLNRDESTAPFLSHMDWWDVRVCIYASEKKINSTSGKKSNKTATKTARRQSRKFLDLGFTSSMCMSRKKSSNGVSKPLVKPGTDDPVVINCFLVLSKIVNTVDLPWLTKQHLQAYIDPNYPQRNDIFASTIHPECCVEALRLHETTVDEPCLSHSDKFNSKQPSMALVVGLSTKLEGKRVGMNGYSRAACDSYLDESNCMDPVLDFIMSVYESIPPTRKNVSTGLLDGSTNGCLGLDYIKNKCNMDPLAYHLPYVHYMLLLAQRFSLTFPEMVGLETAFEVFPNTAYYFVMAATTLLTATSY